MSKRIQQKIKRRGGDIIYQQKYKKTSKVKTKRVEEKQYWNMLHEKKYRYCSEEISYKKGIDLPFCIAGPSKI